MAISKTLKGWKWSTRDASNPTLIAVLDDTSKSLHIATAQDSDTDWNVSALTHPGVYIHSETTPATDYLLLGKHDGTTAYIDNVGGTTIQFAIAGTNEINLTASALSPSTSDGNALGTTALMWADLFLASGAVINFDNGDVTITHTANVLTLAGGTLVNDGNVTISDDVLLGIGTGNTARFSYDTTDANANALLLQLPAGGGTDVPVLAIGQSIESVDLGLYNGVVDPRIAMFGVGAVTTGPGIDFRKARGTIAAPTVVTSGDDLGTIRAYGCVANGEYVQSAEIRFDLAGTVGTTRGPGTITFLTATDAAPSVLTQAMIISAAQKVTIASGECTGDFKLVNTLTAGSDGVGSSGEQLTSGGAAAETNWAAAACLPEFKTVLRERQDTDAALAAMLNTPIYDFRYKTREEYDGPSGRPMGTGDHDTVYTGLMATDAPWATHHNGRILNPINTFGYTVLAIKALQAEIDSLRGQLAAK